jgi:hypothetical protein
MLIEAALLPRNFSFHFITVPVPLRQKVTVPTVPVPVLQHCRQVQEGGAHQVTVHPVHEV